MFCVWRNCVRVLMNWPEIERKPLTTHIITVTVVKHRSANRYLFWLRKRNVTYILWVIYMQSAFNFKIVIIFRLFTSAQPWINNLSFMLLRFDANFRRPDPPWILRCSWKCWTFYVKLLKTPLGQPDARKLPIFVSYTVVDNLLSPANLFSARSVQKSSWPFTCDDAITFSVQVHLNFFIGNTILLLGLKILPKWQWFLLNPFWETTVIWYT